MLHGLELLRVADGRGGQAQMPQERREFPGQGLPAGIAFRGTFGHHAGHDLLQPLGQLRAQHPQRRRGFVKDFVGQRQLVLRHEGLASAEELVERHAEGIHVGAEILFLLLHLLRRHVGGRTLLPQHPCLLAAGELGGAEVRHLDVRLPPQHDVGRFDVPVDDPHAAGVVQGLHALECHLQHPPHGQERVGLAVLAQAAAGDVLHHDVAHVVLDHGVEDAHDMGVGKAPREGGLLEEEFAEAPSCHGVAPDAGEGGLDGHMAAREGVEAQVDDGAGTPPKLPLDAVFSDTGGEIGHQAGRGTGGSRSERPSMKSTV